MRRVDPREMPLDSGLPVSGQAAQLAMNLRRYQGLTVILRRPHIATMRKGRAQDQGPEEIGSLDAPWVCPGY